MSGANVPFIKQAMLMLMSDKCYETFFYKLNFLDIFCLKALISKCLGLALVAGSTMVKVPQITKIWGNQSAEGMSFVSCLTDLYAVTTYTCYSFVRGFPFSAYGDGFFVGVQTFIITVLVLFFNTSSSPASLFSLAYLIIVYILTGGLTPINTLWALQAISVPIMFFGRLMQAYTNYQNKGTGQLSAATCSMLLFGSTARVFTSIQETGDFIVILTYTLATIGNAIIVSQFILYRKPSVPKQTIKEKKTK
uniref:Mannose-P-dolichol utilization defect 1 protein homolog n=1 Tax=Lygus hesperus TaxID=30085 RepID=A0A0A9WN30_LYGHE